MTDGKRIDLARARALVADQIAKKGADYVYQAPSGTEDSTGYAGLYRHDGKPGCIFGHVFDDLGILDGRTPEGQTPASILSGRGWEVSRQADAFMVRVQGDQDRGIAWGEAVEGVTDQVVADELRAYENTTVTAYKGFDENA